MHRYALDRPLPDLAYVPGQTPRPGPPSPPFSATFEPARYRDSPTYLYGFDLFNHGFPWEAHEAWEVLWQKVPRQSSSALLLQALIKLSASHVKRLQASARGRQAHGESAAGLFAQVRSREGDAFAGVDLTSAERAARLAAEGSFEPLLLLGEPA